MRIELIASGVPKMLFEATIHGVFGAALYDTGAMVSVMSRGFYETIGGPKLSTFNRRLVGANGSPLMTYGVCSVDVALGEAVIRQSFVVCEDIAQDLILGMDMIFTHRISMDVVDNGISLRIKDKIIIGEILAH